MAELLPCPFCGSIDLRYDRYWCCDFQGFYVRCLKCDVSGTPKGTKRSARKAWNTRTETKNDFKE
jgi:Lar family restriction alleviation protein